MKITDVLLAEHAVFHNFFDHLEKTAPRIRSPAEIKLLAAALEAIMQSHTKTEDDLLIEPLEHCLEQIGQSETFHDEHEEIEAKLAAVKKARQFKQARSLLLQAVQRAREHFDKEERVVFPLAERLLKAKTLSEMGDEWLSRREMTVVRRLYRTGNLLSAVFTADTSALTRNGNGKSEGASRV
ncbi:MAG TPA: hemerythrin domain-containing protein [Desulfuromonadaceae bacterium]|nr:hemerythrin domain-containing protein [Desulfuromonadaceae bacterium]